MPGRQFNANGYRYGFNGKENDRETVGTGDGTQDYGMRIYNPSLGKFLSVDPLTAKYPFLTAYQFASNSPVMGIDEDGGELKYYNIDWTFKQGKSHLRTTDITYIDDRAFDIVIKAGLTGDKSEVARIPITFSDLGLTNVVVAHKGEWKILPEEFDPSNLPDENDEVWETFETPDQYKERVLENARKIATGLTFTKSSVKGGFLGALKGDIKKLKISASELKNLAKSSKSLIKEAKLPFQGKIRFVPRPEDVKSGKLLKKDGGYVDKFGNVWKKGPSRTKGESFEWDVQLSKTGKSKIGWLNEGKNHVNVSQKGKVTH